MKNYKILILALCCSIPALAQEPQKGKEQIQSNQMMTDAPIDTDIELATDAPMIPDAQIMPDTHLTTPIGEADSYYPESDSLHLPWLNHNGSVMSPGFYGRYFGGWHSWDLHEGLNVNLGASVFAQFGRHAQHGAGFGQHLSAMYATPLNEKLSLAIGGYLNNLYWQHNSMRDAGLSAVLGYQFDEHWEAYLYGQKSIVANGFTPYPLFYGMTEMGDRIGAAVKYNINPSFSIQVSFEHGNWPHRDSFHETYMKMPPPRW